MSYDFNQFQPDDTYSNDLMNKQIDLNNNLPLNEQIKYSDKENKSQNDPSRAQSGQSPSPNSNATEELSINTMAKINSSLSFIGKYFNVELMDVLERLKGASIPFNKSFYQTAEKNPDLYGPLWIYTTLVFVVTVSANISGYLSVRL